MWLNFATFSHFSGTILLFSRHRAPLGFPVPFPPSHLNFWAFKRAKRSEYPSLSVCSVNTKRTLFSRSGLLPLANTIRMVRSDSPQKIHYFVSFGISLRLSEVTHSLAVHIDEPSPRYLNSRRERRTRWITEARVGPLNTLEHANV